jgi:hypothetical protein
MGSYSYLGSSIQLRDKAAYLTKVYDGTGHSNLQGWCIDATVLFLMCSFHLSPGNHSNGGRGCTGFYGYCTVLAALRFFINRTATIVSLRVDLSHTTIYMPEFPYIIRIKREAKNLFTASSG